MSSQKFESLDEDLESLLDKVSKRLEIGISDRQSDEERKRIIIKLDQSIVEARAILNKMDIETRQAPSRFQHKMKSKMTKYSNEIERYVKTINQLRYANLSSNRTINPMPYDNSSNFERDVRSQVLTGTASLERTSESLARSQAIAIETEQIGTEVLGELGVQREALERTRDRLADTDEEVSRSRRVLRRIGSNFMCNKLLLIVIILLEVAILAGLCYWKFFT